MRALIIVLTVMAVSGCASMLIGDASSGEPVVRADERTSSVLASDNAISASIRRQLSADALLRDFPIGIRTIDSKVTLTGTVGSYPARDRAVQIASGTDGVIGVDNRIMVNTNL